MKDLRLETVLPSPSAWLRLFRTAFQRPREFFTAARFEGKPGIAMAVIAATSAIFCLPSPLFSVPILICAVVTAVLLTAALCGVLHFFREFIGTDGGYSAYVRFSAYVFLLHLPLLAFQAVHWKLGVLFGLFLLVWCVWGFHLAFHPRVGRSLVLCLILTTPFVAAGSWMLYRFETSDPEMESMAMTSDQACESMKQLLDVTFAGLPAEQRERELAKMKQEMQDSGTTLHEVFVLLETMSAGQFKIGADWGKKIQKCFDDYLKAK